MSEPFMECSYNSYSNFCISLLGQYSSSIIAFNSSQLIELATIRVKVLAWLFNYDKAESTNVHATYLTLNSSWHAHIWKMDSVFSNHLVNVTTPPSPWQVLELMFMNSLYEHIYWCPWFSSWLEPSIPFPLPLLLLPIQATTAAVTAAWNTTKSICRGSGGGGVVGVSFLCLFDFLGGILLL